MPMLLLYYFFLFQFFFHSTSTTKLAMGEWVDLVIVEAQKPETHPQPEQLVVQVPVGFGAKTIDPATNELGIELKDMEIEFIEDISSDRRLDGWWLTPGRETVQWRTQIKGDFSLNQNIKARTLGNLMQLETMFEGGIFQDHRPIPFMDNQQTPYDSTDDSISSYVNRKNHSYAKFEVQNKNWRSLTDFDWKFKDTHAGTKWTGTKKQWQGSLNGKWHLGSLDVAPFFQMRSDQFNSLINSPSSNLTHGVRGGLQLENKINAFFEMQTNLSMETLNRKFLDNSETQFGRFYGKLLLKGSWVSQSWVEITAHGFSEIVRDEINASNLSISSSSTPIETDFLWDTGVEISTTHRFSFGLTGRFRRYAVLPSPTQRFGDGALLQASPNLLSETGVRISTGPWWSSNHFDLDLSLFSERASHAPIFVAVSPTSVRTLPLGGVWTQGVELKGNLKVWKMTLSPTVTLQEAVNNSQIKWQQGQAIPGRPKWVTKTETRFGYSSFKTGMIHRYQSKDAMDLSGLWSRPPQHQVDLFLGYGKNNWEARLIANNLIQNWNLPQNPNFQGTTAPNLLEPSIQQKEIRIQCEIIL